VLKPPYFITEWSFPLFRQIQGGPIVSYPDLLGINIKTVRCGGRINLVAKELQGAEIYIKIIQLLERKMRITTENKTPKESSAVACQEYLGMLLAWQ